MKIFALLVLAFVTLAGSLPAAGALDPNARKPLIDAQAQLTKDEKAAKELKAKLLAAYEGSEEWKMAQDELKKAQAEVAAAKAPVLKDLHAQADYKAALEKKQAAQAALDTLQKGQPSMEQLTSASEALVTATSAVTRMESEALAASPAVAEAKAKQQAAADQIKVLRGKFEEFLQSDKDYQDALKLVEADKQKVADAKKQLQQQAEAQRQQAKQNRSQPKARSSGGNSRSTKTY